MLGLGNGLTGGVVTEEAAWAVTDLGDLAYWFKYNTNLTLGSGDELATWDSDYGSETLTTAAGKVLKNSGDLNFDNNNGRMALDATWNPGTFSAYLVLRVTNATVSNEEIMNGGNTDFFRLSNSTTVRIKIGNSTSNNITLPGDEITQNTWFVFGIEWDGATISVFQDTDYASPGTATDTDTFAGLASLGLRGNPFDGQIREVVLIDDVLSVSDRAELMTHLISVRDI